MDGNTSGASRWLAWVSRLRVPRERASVGKIARLGLDE